MAGGEREDSGSFFENVFAVVRLIPFGRVTSYGAIAAYLGSRGSARMVGWAMNASHTGVTDIPAHRVVNRNGLLTGKYHFGSPAIMQQLLENEGITVMNDQVTGFDEVFWDPGKEL
ncbi:MAG: MGMT family protein [Bacteroidetes bacterium]|nr:MGMT family protein [Bacteroidota bacterium]